MIKKIACTVCGLSFEVVNLPQVSRVLCPGCSSEVAIKMENAPITLGNYNVVGLIGQGGMGQVYKATDSNGVMFAVKIMTQDLLESPESRERFDREMKIMASLKHNNIVQLLECGKTSMFNYFVMELVDGDNLRSLLRSGPIPIEQIKKISTGMLNALGYAHSMGVVHRDIKPENILFTRSGETKVTDFGLARRFSNASIQENLTATNAFLGTENYMSPEQKINPRNVTHKSDIYSFGVVLYEMLSGGILPMGLFQPPSHYRQVSENWDGISFRLLDINPDMRPLNCQDVLDEIEKIQPAASGSQLISQEAVKNLGKSDHNRAVSGEDILKKESDRIQARLDEMLGIAYDHCQSGTYEEALPLWQQSLNLIDNPEERRNINEWIKYCVNQINAKKQEEHSKSSKKIGSVISSLNPPHFPSNAPEGEEKLMFLCPGCSKPFGKPISETSRGEFKCPYCKEPLSYDEAKKRISPGKDSKVTSSKVSKHRSKVTEIPQEVVENTTATPEPSSFFTGETIWVVMSIILLADFLFPYLGDSFFRRVFNLGLTNVLGFNQAFALIYIRPALRFGLFLIGCFWGYRAYNHLIKTI